MQMKSNTGLLIIAFLCAVSLVWVKGQERITQRTMTGVQVAVQNLPENLVLPDPWIPPTVSLSLLGPRSTLEFLRADQCRFQIDASKFDLPEEEVPLTVTLTEDMFITNLINPQDQNRISVDQERIYPRQVQLQVVPWSMNDERPDLSKLAKSNNLPMIPLLRLQKTVPVVVPTEGKLPDHYQLLAIEKDPQAVTVTGRKEAVDLIEAVSTPILVLDSFEVGQSVWLPLGKLPFEGLRLVNDEIRGVTVTVNTRRSGNR